MVLSWDLLRLLEERENNILYFYKSEPVKGFRFYNAQNNVEALIVEKEFLPFEEEINEI